MGKKACLAKPASLSSHFSTFSFCSFFLSWASARSSAGKLLGCDQTPEKMKQNVTKRRKINKLKQEHRPEAERCEASWWRGEINSFLVIATVKLNVQEFDIPPACSAHTLPAGNRSTFCVLVLLFGAFKAVILY